MRIAFDVKGTLDGPKGDILLQALKKLQELGHDITVWSNSMSYAVAIAHKHGLKVRQEMKRLKSELRAWGIEPYDVAIEDDRSQTWLGANSFVFVDEVPDNVNDAVTLISVRGLDAQYKEHLRATVGTGDSND